MNMNQLLTHESESIATAMQSLKKANNWLSSFLESYSPPLDGERYLTDKELSEHLKLSRRTLQEYRKQGILPYIILCGKTLYPESEGSPDISRGNFFDSTEKFIPLHHEQSRTIIIGTVDTAIRDTFKF